MYSSTLKYQLPVFGGVMSHGWQRVALVRDTAEDEQPTPNILDIQVQSGDYFVTLATQLDVLSAQLGDWRARSKLEDVVSDLIYLQDNYQIVKKEQD